MYRFPVLKESVIPDEEDIDGPDLPAVICLFVGIFSIPVIFQHFQKDIRIKKLLCG